MNMPNPFPTPAELAAEIREAYRQHPPLEGRELYTWLVRQGFINAQGQVTRLIGGSAEPEPNYETWRADEDTPGPKNGPAKRGQPAKRKGTSGSRRPAAPQ
jgi:hypothetical protein